MTALRDVAFGVRLALAGGRASIGRLVLAAVGVAVSVTILLVAVVVPGALGAGQDRELRRMGETHESTNDPLLMRVQQSTWRGEQLTVIEVEATGPTAPTPPGVERIPRPGEVVASPALRRALEGDGGELLRPRAPGTVVGDIGRTGLIGPDELFAYVGRTGLADATGVDGTPNAQRVHAFGQTAPSWSPGFSAALLALLAVIVVAGPMPVLIAASARIGSATRDRRLAAVRLLGVSRRAAVRMVAGETLVGVVAGLLLAAALFALVVALAPVAPVGDGLFGADLLPSVAVVVAIVVLVPTLAVVASVVALRPVVVEPLAVVREAPTRRRRFWWRVSPLVPALALLGGMAMWTGPGGSFGLASVILGAALMMLTTTLLLPWLIERVAHALPAAGPPSWEIARAALRADGGASARILGVVTAALLGVIVFHTTATTLEQFDERGLDLAPQPGVVHVLAFGDRELEPPLRESGVVLQAWTFRLTHTAGFEGPSTTIAVGDCAALAAAARLPSCADGDVFVMRPAEQLVDLSDSMPEPGRSVTIPAASHDRSLDMRWTVPADAPTVPPTELGRELSFEPTILWTTGAAPPGVPLHGARAIVRVDPHDPDAVERIRNAVAPTGHAEIRTDEEARSGRGAGFWSLQAVMLTVSALVALGAAVAGLVVLAIERIRARRHALATLVAGGCRRRVLAAALWWQLATPMAVAVSLAVVGGVGIGMLIGEVVGAPPTVNWAVVAGVVAAATVAVALGTTAALPVLRRACRVAELRTE